MVVMKWPANREPEKVYGAFIYQNALAYAVQCKSELDSSSLTVENCVLIYSPDFRRKFPKLLLNFLETKVKFETTELEQFNQGTALIDKAAEAIFNCKKADIDSEDSSDEDVESKYRKQGLDNFGLPDEYFVSDSSMDSNDSMVRFVERPIESPAKKLNASTSSIDYRMTD